MSVMVVDFCRSELDTVYSRHSYSGEKASTSCGSERKRSKVSCFLTIMAVISMATGIDELLLPVSLVGQTGVTLCSLGVAMVGQLLVALLGSGLAVCLTRGTRDSAERSNMILAPFVALGVGSIFACLSHLCGQTSALGWLVSPIYLLWAWGSAASGN